MEFVIGIVLGIVSGILSGLVGIGGGTVIIPILVMGLNYTQHQAQGTALMAFAFPIFAAAAWNYYRYGRVRIWLALAMAVALAVSSYVVAQLVVKKVDSEELKKIFAVFLVLMSGLVFYRSIRPIQAKTTEPLNKQREGVVGLIVGALTGAIKGLTGLGGGVVMVPLLLLLGRVDQHTAQGTSLFTMTLPVAFMAAIPYWQSGHVQWWMVWGLVIGVLAGSFFSSRFAQKLAGPLLARIFSVTIGIMGIFMLIK